MLSEQRHLLVASEIQRALGEILTEIWALEDSTLLNISKVEVSKDLSQAKVYYNFWPQGNVKQDRVKFSKLYREVVRRLHESIQIRKLPKLKFIYDLREDRAEEILNLLNKLKEQDEADYR